MSLKPYQQILALDVISGSSLGQSLSQTPHRFQVDVLHYRRKKNVPREAEQAESESMGAECFTLTFSEGSLKRLSVKTRSHSQKMWNLLSHLKEKCHLKCNSFGKCIYQDAICGPFLIKEKSWNIGEVILTVIWPASGRVFSSKVVLNFLFLLKLLLALSLFLLIIGFNAQLQCSDGQDVPFLIYRWNI